MANKTAGAQQAARAARANVPSIRQQTQYTCVSTSVAAALQALGKPQCTEGAVNEIIGAAPMRGARWEEALGAIQYFGCRGHLVVPATLAWVKQHTDQGHPVLIAWNPEGRPWSHASCIFNVDSQYVYVMDPNCPDPNQTTRVVPHAVFYKQWSEKASEKLLIRRPAVAVTLEVDAAGRQVMAKSKRAPKTQQEKREEKNRITVKDPKQRDPAGRARAEGQGPRSGPHRDKRDVSKGWSRKVKHKPRYAVNYFKQERENLWRGQEEGLRALVKVCPSKFTNAMLDRATNANSDLTPRQLSAIKSSLQRNGLRQYVWAFEPNEKLSTPRWATQETAMNDLRNATIRLASENPELRSHLLPLLANTKQASGSDILLTLLGGEHKFFKIVSGLSDTDEQAMNLLDEVYSKLSDAMNLSRGQQNALRRLQQVVQNPNWDPDLQRNNIFKAANELGIRLPSGMFASTQKTAQTAFYKRDGVTKDAVRKGTAFMAYVINDGDVGKNHSKYYEAWVDGDDMTGWTVHRRWGALSDSLSTGRHRALDNEYDNERAAMRAFALVKKKRMQKKSGGISYIDAFGPKHKTPDGKKLPMGEYPIGLDRKPSFGHGVQQMAKCSPYLRQMLKRLEEASAMTDRDESTQKIVQALAAADGMVKWLADADGEMGKKVRGMIRDIIGRLQGVGKYLPDETGVQMVRDMNRLTNYLEKQLSLCNH